MLTNNYRIWSRILLSVFCITILSGAVWAQGNAFSFQGRLNDGTTPANGSYDLQFRLYNAATGGTQIGTTTALHPNTTLINGVFSDTLDFGAAAFNNPNSVFIEIRIRPNGSPNAYTILGPRQQLTVVPFAVRAANATNADNATNAQNALVAVYATSAGSATQLDGVPASEYVTKTNGGADFIRNTTLMQPTSNFSISGDGRIGGTLVIVGNTIFRDNIVQTRDKSGLVKAMIYVSANAAILRCYNGNTAASTGNCGFSVTKGTGTIDGHYNIDMGFQVSDRFVSVTPSADGGAVNIGVNFRFITSNPNLIQARLFKTDVTYLDSSAANSFILIVY